MQQQSDANGDGGLGGRVDDHHADVVFAGKEVSFKVAASSVSGEKLCTTSGDLQHARLLGRDPWFDR